jgi:hypothetical protein
MTVIGPTSEMSLNGLPASIALKKQRKMLPERCFTTKAAANLPLRVATDKSEAKILFLQEMISVHQETVNIE